MTASFSQAWRSWRAAPGVALLAVLAFAVGIGSATAIFTVINGVLLRPLPYAQGERFVTLFGARTNEPGRYMAHAFTDAVEYQRRVTAFDVFGWFRLRNFNLTSPGEPQYVSAVAVTIPLVNGLGVEPMLGRWFTDDTGVVIAHSLWRRLGADPDVVGTAMTLDGRQFTVTGVMNVGFRLPVAGTTGGNSRAEIWLALDSLAKGEAQERQGIHFIYARRKPGVSLEQAEADAKRVAAHIVELDPEGHPSYTSDVVDLSVDSYGGLRPPLLALFGGAGLVLLIACANVATLLLARAVARSRETAVRVALGASRRQLAAGYFAEAAIVALLGSVAGVLFSLALTRIVLAAGSEYIPYADEIALEWPVLAFGVALAFVTSALTLVAPLWQAMRIPPNDVLSAGIRASASARVRRLSHGLVVAEIALAFTLLTVSVILVLHLRGLLGVGTGADPNNLVAFEIVMPQQVILSDARYSYERRLMDALRAAPGVTGAAFSNQLALDGACCFGGTVHAEGQPPTPDTRRVSFMFVTPEYLDTMRIPLRAGRFLTDADLNVSPSEGQVLSVVINEAAARRYWPNRNPLGVYGRLNGPDGPRFEVVGVATDVRNDGLNHSTEAELYLPPFIPINPLQIVVRSAQPLERLVPELRRAIRAVDSTRAMHDLKTMNAIVDESVQIQRVTSLMMGFFAATAVLMATLGVYGVVSYGVRQRTVEMGTRMALGAAGRNVIALIVGAGLKMAATGIIVGGAALVAAVWVLVRFLEVRDIGWAAFVSSMVAVALVTTVASYGPAWRASLLSPLVAIRDERPSGLGSAARRVRQGLRSVGQAIAPREDESNMSAAVLSDFVAAARSAESYAEALRSVLATLCDRLHVHSALLLERKNDTYRPAVAIGPLASAGRELAVAGFLSRRLEAYPLPLPFVPGETEALSEWAAEHRPDRLDEIRWLAAASVRLAVPLRTRTDAIGMLLLDAPANRDHFTAAEKQTLRICADQFALMIENGRLTDRVVEQEKVRRDLALAAEVQKRLLPAQPPSDPFADFSAVSIPARSIGGDYYDFVQTGEHRVGIALADVSGKGIAAALIMSVVQASLRIVTSDGSVGAPQLAAKLNQFLYRSTPASKYATFFYAQVDSGCRQLRYVNAGHNPPYLFRAGSHPAPGGAAPPIEELSTGGMVVGMFPEAEYEEGIVELQPGDVLVAFTDGVPEAHNPAGEEFGEDRLKQVIGPSVTLPAAEISAQISTALEQWIQDAEQYDDMTFVVMKVN